MERRFRTRWIGWTTRGQAFGKDDHTFEHKGFYLRSSEYPAAVSDGLFVRGDSEEDDNRVVCVPSEEWLDALRDTVKAYNRYFADDLKGDSADGNVEEIE